MNFIQKIILSIFFTTLIWGETVNLQNATATYSQTNFSVQSSIDGSYSTGTNGWAISSQIVNQTAVWETAANLNATTIQFAMHQLHSNPYHVLGRFRWSYTTTDRSTFANGLANGGDVDTTWVVFDTATTISSTSGNYFTTLADKSLLVSGTTPASAVYYITYTLANITGITGFRLEVLEDASLPNYGPGRASNGNFVLTELVVTSTYNVPEPTSLLLFGMFIIFFIKNKFFFKC